ncbi:hypothetical protein HDU82_006636 [Entophlyctis luteolus]|nr:hypothetical protein HDU82_006636 [Entophlyctis luteolus]
MPPLSQIFRRPDSTAAAHPQREAADDMFRKRTATPEPKPLSAPQDNVAASELEPPQSPEIVITQESFIEPPSSPAPQIKSVSLSLQPPAAKPQRAELNEPTPSPVLGAFDGGPTGPDASERAAGRPLPQQNPFIKQTLTDTGQRSAVASPAQSPKPPPKAAFGLSRKRTKTNEPSSTAPPTALEKQLSAISEAPSADEKATRPNTAANTINPMARPATAAGANAGENTERDWKEKRSAKINDGPEILVEDEFGAIEQSNQVVNTEEVSKASLDTDGSSPAPSLKRIPKKKLVQIDPPQSDRRGVRETVRAKPTAKSLHTEPQKTKLNSDLKPVAKKPSVVKKEKEEAVEIIEIGPQVVDQGDSIVASTDSLKIIEIDDFAEEIPESEVRRQTEARSPKPRKRLDEPKHRAEPATPKSAKKSQTPKSAAPRRESNSRARVATANVAKKHRRPSKMDTDGFSAMGLVDPDEDRPATRGNSQGGKKLPSQPAPPPHYTLPTSSRKLDAQKKGKVKRNSSARRQSLKAMGQETVKIPGLPDQVFQSGRFGHYDLDDFRSKSIEPEKTFLKLNKQDSMDSLQQLNELTEHPKLIKEAERQFLTSSAIQAAQEEGLVSPEAARYLAQYMAAKAKHQQKQQHQQPFKTKSSSDLRLERSFSMMNDNDDDRNPRGTHSKRGAARDSTGALDRFASLSKPLFRPHRGSIMDDDPPPPQQEDEAKVRPPRPVPKTRISIVTKPRKKKPSSASLQQDPAAAMHPQAAAGHLTNSFWGGGGASAYPAAFTPYYGTIHPSSLQHHFPAQQPQPQHHPPLPTYTGAAMLPHAAGALPALPGAAQSTVPAGLVPARIRLTAIPVVTYRQSYVIEPTGHAPGTYVPPEEIGPNAVLTYISAYPGTHAIDSMGAGYPDSRKHVQGVNTKRELAAQTPSPPDPPSLPQKQGVRSLIEKGVIGRGSRS